MPSLAESALTITNTEGVGVSENISPQVLIISGHEPIARLTTADNIGDENAVSSSAKSMITPDYKPYQTRIDMPGRALTVAVFMSNGKKKRRKVHSVDEAFALCRSLGGADWKLLR